jgi:Bacterial Ig-like domain
MDRPTAQAAFSLRRTGDGAAVAGKFSWSGNKMTFRPSVALAEATGYTSTVGRGALDAAGNQLGASAVSTFQTGTTVTAHPSAATVETGSLRAGSHTALALDDDVHYAVDSTATSTRTTSWVAVTGGVSNGLTTLRLAYRGRSSIACTQTISLWNWAKNGWTNLDARTVGSTEVLVDKAVSGILGDYVTGTSGDGELRARVRCTNGTASFYTSAELLRLTYTR